jgi:hypothetical protein
MTIDSDPRLGDAAVCYLLLFTVFDILASAIPESLQCGDFRAIMPSAAASAVVPAHANIDKIADLNVAYDEVFRSLRVLHFTPEQLMEAAIDNEIPLDFLEASIDSRSAIMAKVSRVCCGDVLYVRVRFLRNVSPPLIPALAA